MQLGQCLICVFASNCVLSLLCTFETSVFVFSSLVCLHAATLEGDRWIFKSSFTVLYVIQDICVTVSSCTHTPIRCTSVYYVAIHTMEHRVNRLSLQVCQHQLWLCPLLLSTLLIGPCATCRHVVKGLCFLLEAALLVAVTCSCNSTLRALLPRSSRP